MSLCVFLQYEDHIIVGADTAVTHTQHGAQYRGSIGVDKLVRVDDYLIFISGRVSLAFGIIEAFRQEKEKSISNLQRIIKRRYRQEVKEDPKRVKDEERGGGSILGVICFEVDKLGRTITHSFSYENGYNNVRRRGQKGSMHLVTGGFRDKEASRLAQASYFAGLEEPRTLIKNTIESLSGESIGGELTLYMVDASGIIPISRAKINEVIKYPTLDANPLTSHLQGGTITGALLRTSASGARFEADLSGWRTFDTTNRERISIATNNAYGMNAIQFSKSSGERSGTINGSNIGLTIESNGTLFLGALGGGDVQVQGSTQFHNHVTFGGGASGITVSSVDGLQPQLSAINSKLEDTPSLSQTATNMSFDPSTRNLKLYSATGATLATVNIPK